MSNSNFSKIIAGTMTWGHWGKNFTTQEFTSMIHGCVDLGVSTFDLADIYGLYTTEANFGKGLKESGLNRNQIQLITKCGIQLESAERGTWVKHYDYSAKYLISSAEQSLKNLQTDFLDLFLLHRPSPLLQAEEVAEAISHLKQAGKILDFGVSNFNVAQMELISSQIPISVNQIEFSINHFTPMLDGMFDYLQKKQIGVQCWSPLGTVFKQESEQNLRIKNLLVKLSLKFDVEPETILLAWIMKHPSNPRPVVGSGNLHRMAAMARARPTLLELQDWFALWTESAGTNVA